MEMLKLNPGCRGSDECLRRCETLGLDEYIAKNASVPAVAKEGQPTAEHKGNASAKACCDAEMIHIGGVTTARGITNRCTNVLLISVTLFVLCSLFSLVCCVLSNDRK